MQNYFETNTKPLFAADFDYFRIPREQWELMLVRLKQMGVNAVAVSLPWSFHEFQQGTVDLNGTTSARRDVVGLLQLCVAFDLPCILKPGPYSDRGVLGEGIPAWLLRDVDRLDDVLPAVVGSWFKALSRMLLPDQQWPDGPIVVIQIDGEPARERQPRLSAQLTEVKWPIWLRKHYDGIEALNTAYGTTYRTVSDVAFPQTWANETTALEKDARTFLDEVRGDRSNNYAQLLANAGWQIPVYPDALDAWPDLPVIHTHSLASPDALPALGRGKKISGRRVILNLQHPIQVDPDPVDVGCGPVWAEEAPVRADGSVRPRFWTGRQYLWRHTVRKTTVEDGNLIHSFKDGLLVTRWSDALLKIETELSPPLTAFRLNLNGELIVDKNLKVRRGKLSGLYLAEGDAGQTDLVFLWPDATVPLNGFLLDYLRVSLLARVQVLTRCARLAERMGNMLTVSQAGAGRTGTTHSPVSTYTLEEARRGLSEADAALRKAMASINALSDGFATILDKPHQAIPQPAASPVAISLEVFADEAQEILIEVGSICAEVGPQLEAAVEALNETVDVSPFTVEQYQYGYATAVTTAQAVRESLLKVISKLRLEIATERLPLVTWRIHDQVQAMAESLRWGVILVS